MIFVKRHSPQKRVEGGILKTPMKKKRKPTRGKYVQNAIKAMDSNLTMTNIMNVTSVIISSMVTKSTKDIGMLHMA